MMIYTQIKMQHLMDGCYKPKEKNEVKLKKYINADTETREKGKSAKVYEPLRSNTDKRI